MPSLRPHADAPSGSGGLPIAVGCERPAPAEVLDLFVAADYASSSDEPSLRLLETALSHSNVIVTARTGGVLVGVARGWSDFAAIAYLADIAVHGKWRRQGIGRSLLHSFKRAAGGGEVRLLLLARPDADGFYRRLGLEPVPEALRLA